MPQESHTDPFLNEVGQAAIDWYRWRGDGTVLSKEEWLLRENVRLLLASRSS